MMPELHVYNPTIECGDADANCREDARKYQEIAASIRKASDLKVKVAAAFDDLKKAQGGYVFDWTSWDSWKKRYAGEQRHDPTEEADAASTLSKVRNEQFADYNHAIVETIELYHLVPKRIAPMSHPGGNYSDVTAWRPHCNSQERRDKEGNSIPFSDDDKIDQWARYGKTYPPGSKNVPDAMTAATDITTHNIGIFAGAFVDATTKEPTPNALALYILHETAHWLDFDAIGNRPPNPSEKFHSEVFAYQSEIDIAPALGIVDTGNFAAWRDKYKFQSAHAPYTYGELEEGKEGKYKDWAPAGNIVVPDEYHAEEIDHLVYGAIRYAKQAAAHEEKELRETLARNIETLTEKARARRAKAAAEDARSREAVEEMMRNWKPSPPAPAERAKVRSQEDIQRWAEYFDGRAQIMRAIVRSACSTGANLTSDDIPPFYQAYRVLNGNDEHSLSDHGVESALNGLSGCDLELMKTLLDANTRYPEAVDVGEIRKQYQTTLPPPGRGSTSKTDSCHVTITRGDRTTGCF